MVEDFLSVFIVVLVILVGGLIYLIIPGRLNGPTPEPSQISTSTELLIDDFSVEGQIQILPAE